MSVPRCKQRKRSDATKIAMSSQAKVPLRWEECGCILKQLQVAAQAVHNEVDQTSDPKIPSTICSVRGSNLQLRKLLQDILRCLQAFRESINGSFLQDKTGSGELLQELKLFEREQMERILELLTASQIHTGCTVPTIGSIQQQREASVQEELVAVTQINATLSIHCLPNVNPADQECLEVLITRLRHLEQQLEFHRGLLQVQQDFSGPTNAYSSENFAYGSTPFPTWIHLFTQDAVRDMITRSPTQTLTVFGSSTGSLVFFGALTLGLSCVGVEILPFLHDIAKKTRKDLQIPEGRCRFVCADMLTVPLQETSILLLTSQCWDTALYQQVQCKLELELQPGTLVIDYKDTLQNSSCFVMVRHVMQQRVSWTNSQSLYIFERVESKLA